MDVIGIDDFLRIDVRVGTIVAAVLNEGARKPALRLTIDFGPSIGTRTSSAQLAALYDPACLIGTQVAAVLNFPPRLIAKVMSEVLVLGFPDTDGNVVLVRPDRTVPDGGRLY